MSAENAATLSTQTGASGSADYDAPKRVHFLTAYVAGV